MAKSGLHNLLGLPDLGGEWYKGDMPKTKSGFTIIELLIVIVIIAILAAITLVAYSSIQQRAKNVQRIAAAKEWQKRIIAYTATNGKYPFSTSGHFCLGSEGYPTDLDANSDIDCFSSNNVKHPNTAIDAAWATLGSLPVFPGDKLDTGTGTTGYGVVAGISVRNIDTAYPIGGSGSTETPYPMLFYWLYGKDQDCVLQPVARAISGVFQQTSEVNSGNSGGLTECVILLPDPAAL